MIEHKEIHTAPESLEARVFDILARESDTEFLAGAQAFINDRLKQLEADTEPKGISIFNPHHMGFIHAESEIRMQALVPGFYVDDPDIYLAAMTTMKEFYEKPTWQNQEQYRKLAFFSVQYALERYFGNTFPSDAQQAERTRRIWNNDIVSDEDQTDMLTHIADFKNIALCVERSAAANNMLSLFGIETELVIGNLEQDGKGNKAEAHAFLITTNPMGEKLIFDPTHPHVTRNEKAQSLKPFIARGGEEYLVGNNVVVTHTDIIHGEEVSREYTYIPPPAGLLAA